MNAVMLYEPSLSIQDVDAQEAAGLISELSPIDERTVRKFAKRLAKTAADELAASEFSFFVPLPDWSDSCSPRYVVGHEPIVAGPNRGDLKRSPSAAIAEKLENLTYIYERSVRTLSENSDFFAWVKGRLFERQAVSAQEIREYGGSAGQYRSKGPCCRAAAELTFATTVSTRTLKR